MTDQFANWRKRLAGEKVPTYETEPDPGYYRQAIQTKDPKTGVRKTVGWVPVAIFMHEGEPCAMVGRGDDRAFVGKDELIERLWLWVVKHPIAEELYFGVAERGEKWPDLAEPIAQPSSPAEPQGEIDEPAPRGIGDNKPPEQDRLAEMREQIANAAGAAKALKVTDEESSKLAQSSRARLNELANNADKLRVKEKEPHKTAADAVDAAYMPMIKEAQQAAELVRKTIEDFLTKQRREAAAALAAAELKRRMEIAAEAERQAAAERPPAGTSPPPPPPPPAPPPSQIKGAVGKAATVEMEKYAIVNDWLMIAGHYSGRQEMRELIQKLADRDAKAGLTIPGATIDERAKLR